MKPVLFSAIHKADVKAGSVIRQNKPLEIFNILDNGQTIQKEDNKEVVRYRVQRDMGIHSVMCVEMLGEPEDLDIVYRHKTGLNRGFDLLG